ncbi:MAG: hypothetical protein ACLRI8_03935 [Agathobacter rectalis]
MEIYGKVISIVGAGGKTTLVHKLAGNITGVEKVCCHNNNAHVCRS